MSQKKRIYDLAKEYGMTGRDLAEKLRSLGFSQVKSHMTALDDFEVLQVQGVLEAHGLVAEMPSDAGSSAGGGLILRKKKKKKKVQPAEEPDETSAEEPSPADPAQQEEPEAPAEEEQEQPEPALEEQLPETVSEPAPSLEPAAAPAAPPAVSELAEAAEITASSGLAEEELAVESEVSEPVAEAPSEALPVHEIGEESTQPVVEAEATKPTAEITAEEPVAGNTETAEGAKAAPKRGGKVVGFIDLSKIKTTEKKKPESRRLHSKDDVTPDVRPTLGHDRRRALMRGDSGSRGQLSASQLREREAGRFLRRQRVGPGGPSGGRGRGRRDEAMASPYSGTTVRIDMPITVKKLANTLAVNASAFLKVAWKHLGGFGSVQINSTLDGDTAMLLANEFAVELEIQHEVEAEQVLVDELMKKRSGIEDDALATRPPTIAFLGHVDHGKTTLIDAIRSSQIAEGESGGITQHIGAYQVTTEHGHTLTIIDTPGHAAFTGMRARGARAVDIVVLVVAGDAGVQPHTEEAINHARAAKTPIVVAVTKMDKPEANEQRTREMLAALDVVPEEWGGEVAMMPVSGLKGTGVEELLERVFLESEVLDKRCHPEGPASGVVLEAEVQQGKGIVAHLLVQDGTLNRGDIILAGEGYGKVRSIHTDRGKTIETASPSTPVEVSGLSALPGVGEPFYVIESLNKAKEVAEERERKNRANALAGARRSATRNILEAVAEADKQSINLIVRADVQGSVEVLKQTLLELSHPEIDVKVLHAGVGAVTESDVLLGTPADALVIAFNVGVNDKARAAAEKANLGVRHYSVIYEVLDDIKMLQEGFLAPEISEEVTSHVEIRRLFRSSKIGLIAGCHVLDGKIERDNGIRLLRDGAVVYNGKLASLKREKDDAKEVREGFDCGIVLHNYQDIREGDVVESFKLVETKRTLEDRPRK